MFSNGELPIKTEEDEIIPNSNIRESCSPNPTGRGGALKKRLCFSSILKGNTIKILVKVVK